MINSSESHELRPPPSLTLKRSTSMTIYNKQRRTKVNYRKLYEQYYGPIPREDSGRKYEIHHKDGNSHNNNPENLIAISIQDHYDVHHKQGDWTACLRIAAKMKWSTEQISEIAKLNHLHRLEKGTHPWQKRADGSSHTKDRISKPGYVNPFTGRNKGIKNSKYDPTIHTFHNIETGVTVQMTQYEFVTTQDVDQGSASRLINGKYKTTRGWKYITRQSELN